MNISDIYEVAQKIGNYFNGYENFGANLYDDTADEATNLIENILFNADIFEERKYYTGATKFVIEFKKNSDWVIKIPFNGQYFDEEAEDENDFVKFSNADQCNELFEQLDLDLSTTSYWNYINRECLLYEKFVEDGFEDIFIPNFLIANTNYPIYIQKSIIPFKTKIFTTGSRALTAEEKRKTYRLNSTYTFCRLPPEWLADVYSYFGDDRAETIYDYLLDKFEDLHPGNVGYDKQTGCPVIFDYGDFFE